MLIYILIAFVILCALYYVTQEPYTVVVPTKKIVHGKGKKKYIVRKRREPVGWDLLYPFYPGEPSYPYYRYIPYRRGYSYV